MSVNNDTVYSIANVDTSGGPVRLDVPDSAGRYYVLQFVDVWTNNFAYAGHRATGTAEGSFLLVYHDVYEDAAVIAFLARYPTLLGSCLVAPKLHAGSWVHDLDEAEYLALQRVVHRVARAVAAVVPAERVYCLSLGSQQGHAHLHWHIAPLPPGVPYHRQHYYALMAGNGVLNVDDSTQAALARAIRGRLQPAIPGRRQCPAS